MKKQSGIILMVVFVFLTGCIPGRGQLQTPVAAFTTVPTLTEMSVEEEVLVLPSATMDISTSGPTTATPWTISSQTCNAFVYEHDESVDTPVEQGTLLMPGMHFTKVWQVQNSGTCTWTTEYKLIFKSGADFGSPAEINLEKEILPGEHLDIVVPMIAPQSPGDYRGEWLLQSPEGEEFGWGAKYNSPLPVYIRIPDLPGNTTYDFIMARCLAQWHTQKASFLPCDGNPNVNSKQGYIYQSQTAKLEGGESPSWPVLVVRPSNDAYISGYFPAVYIDGEEIFNATIGCLDKMKGCDVIFQLKAEDENGTIYIVEEWEKTFDGEVKNVSASLSELQGLVVKPILNVIVDGGKTSQNIVFWGNPRIIQK